MHRRLHRFVGMAMHPTNTRSHNSNADPSKIRVHISEVKAFIESCMLSVGAKASHGSQLAEVLVAADYRGHFSHGLNRLEMYVNDLKSKTTISDREPTIICEKTATAYVNGENLLGPVVGNFAMQLAIQKARDSGVGMVTAKGSNHYGIAGWYSMQASDIGMLGMSFTNTSPLQVPTRGKKPVLGTNPLTLAAPGRDGDSFVLDMATSGVAVGKVEICDVQKTQMPRGWGVDNDGQETTDPKAVLGGGALLPLGGLEITSGYKGYGLAMLVEIFCGILANADYGPNIRFWKDNDREANLGQCFLAIDPEAFAPGFQDRMQDMIDICRASEPVDPSKQVLVPGDPERNHMAMCDTLGGIPYHPNLIEVMARLAKETSVEPMKTVT